MLCIFFSRILILNLFAHINQDRPDNGIMFIKKTVYSWSCKTQTHLL